MKHIGVIGIGGVGGYFGGKLARQLRADPDYAVYFIARGTHLEVIQKEGLLLSTSDEGEFVCHAALATDRIEALPVLDICLICVKSYDLETISKRLQSIVSEKTMILPLLNGVDINERIRSVLDTGLVFPGCVYVGTHIERPGCVVQNGGACQILFGNDPRFPDIIPHALIRLLDRCDIRNRWIADPYPAIWEKFLFIAAFGMAGAVYNKSLGQLTADRKAGETVKSIMEEIVLLANKKQIQLPADIVKITVQKAAQFPCETKCSFHRDFEQADKPDERSIFGDAILQMGRSLGIDLPVTAEMVRQLEKMKPAVRGTLSESFL